MEIVYKDSVSSKDYYCFSDKRWLYYEYIFSNWVGCIAQY